MGSCKDPKHFVGETLPYLLDAFKVKDDGTKTINTIQKAFRLRARYQRVVSVPHKIYRDYCFGKTIVFVFGELVKYFS